MRLNSPVDLGTPRQAAQNGHGMVGQSLRPVQHRCWRLVITQGQSRHQQIVQHIRAVPSQGVLFQKRQHLGQGLDQALHIPVEPGHVRLAHNKAALPEPVHIGHFFDRLDPGHINTHTALVLWRNLNRVEAVQHLLIELLGHSVGQRDQRLFIQIVHLVKSRIAQKAHASLGHAQQHIGQFVHARLSCTRRQQGGPQAGFILAPLGQEQAQLQVPQLRVIGVEAAGLLKQLPGLVHLALIGQDAHQPTPRRGGQGLVRVLRHAVNQVAPLTLLPMVHQGFHIGIKSDFVALIERLQIHKHRAQQAYRAVLPARIVPAHCSVAQGQCRHLLELVTRQPLRRSVLQRQHLQGLGRQRQRRVLKLGATLLEFAARAAMTRPVALCFGQTACSPAVRWIRHLTPKLPRHMAQTAGQIGKRDIRHALQDGGLGQFGLDKPVTKIIQRFAVHQAAHGDVNVFFKHGGFDPSGCHAQCAGRF